MKEVSSTIAACATSPAPAGVAVIRMSGPASKEVLQAIFLSKKDPTKYQRSLILGDIIDKNSREILDHCLVVFMAGPSSFTGEDIVEIQCHGSPVLVKKILRSLYSCGVLPANPGEFTQRAFLNGKLDLIQAEAIADLIDASTEQAVKLATEQLNGRLSSAINDIGTPVREALAELEASIDFPEEDINPESQERVVKALVETQKGIDKLIDSYSYGQVIKEGFRILLAGPPNAGKSSLLNHFVGHQRAIVSDISGTTRDILEEEVSIDGLKFIFCDSAGLRETTDTIEQIGIELARNRIPWADLVLFIIDGNDTGNEWLTTAQIIKSSARRVWLIVNKVDVDPDIYSKIELDPTIFNRRFFLSAKTKSGISALQDALLEEVRSGIVLTEVGGTTLTNERHRLSLLMANEAIERAVKAHYSGFPTEILSIELRNALRSLDEIIGKTSTEDLLGTIFSKFCIGK